MNCHLQRNKVVAFGFVPPKHDTARSQTIKQKQHAEVHGVGSDIWQTDVISQIRK